MSLFIPIWDQSLFSLEIPIFPQSIEDLNNNSGNFLNQIVNSAFLKIHPGRILANTFLSLWSWDLQNSCVYPHFFYFSLLWFYFSICLYEMFCVVWLGTNYIWHNIVPNTASSWHILGNIFTAFQRFIIWLKLSRHCFILLLFPICLHITELSTVGQSHKNIYIFL